MSDAEKAKSRAERFGMSASDIEEKKAARAARFGLSNSSQKIGKLMAYFCCLVKYNYFHALEPYYKQTTT